MSLLFNMLSRLIITFLPRSEHLLISWLQSPCAVILKILKIKSATISTVSPSICYEVMGPDTMILVFWMLSFKQTFSLSSFTFIKRLLVLHFFHKSGVICISEDIDISPSNLGSSLCFFQPSILTLMINPFPEPFSRGSSQPRNQTRVSCIAGWFFTSWDTREALIEYYSVIKGYEIRTFVEMWMDLESVIQGERSQREKKQISHINAYMWYLEKWYRCRDTHEQNKCMDTKRRRGRVGGIGRLDLV